MNLRYNAVMAEYSPTRSFPHAAVQRKRLRDVARPFTKDIMRWQARLAFYRTSREAPKSSIEDAVTAGAGLGDLLAEVQEAQKLFARLTQEEPMEGGIEDAARAFNRLLQQISAELR